MRMCSICGLAWSSCRNIICTIFVIYITSAPINILNFAKGVDFTLRQPTFKLFTQVISLISLSSAAYSWKDVALTATHWQRISETHPVSPPSRLLRWPGYQRYINFQTNFRPSSKRREINLFDCGSVQHKSGCLSHHKDLENYVVENSITFFLMFSMEEDLSYMYVPILSFCFAHTL